MQEMGTGTLWVEPANARHLQEAGGEQIKDIGRTLYGREKPFTPRAA